MANKKTDKIVALAKQKSEAKEKLVLAVIEAMQQEDETENYNSVDEISTTTNACGKP